LVTWRFLQVIGSHESRHDVNWLEVGCPHCPSKVTFPRSAAGRTVVCPECEHSYLVPTPSAKPTTSSEAWAAEPAKSPVKELEKTSRGYDAPTLAYEPQQLGLGGLTVADSPAAVRDVPPDDATPVPPSPADVVAPKPGAHVEPQLAVDSPLPELPILDPPRRPQPVANEAQPAPPPPARPRAPEVPPPRPSSARNQPSATLSPGLPPNAPQESESREMTAEAKLRMRRAELRARVNLAIFVGGTVVMVVFAWLVIHFSRPH
jgi:hypothetical protein